jgi:uracil-DNA glycosylase family 4
MRERPCTLALAQKRAISCRRCPRLVRWRERVAREKVKRFADQEYWGRPVPGFGDPQARVLLVGLAPAAHGGNRAGRMFTGDESGNWLFRALHRAGFADRPDSLHRRDGLTLTGCYVTATLRCAPPLNKPLPLEIRRCRPHLLGEIQLLSDVRVVVGLGRIGFENALNAYRFLGRIDYKRKPRFGHAAVYRFGNLTFIASFHPSQQNTFTGRLTEKMLDGVFRRVREVLA